MFLWPLRHTGTVARWVQSGLIGGRNPVVDDLPRFDSESAMEEGGRKRDFRGTNDTFFGGRACTM